MLQIDAVPGEVYQLETAIRLGDSTDWMDVGAPMSFETSGVAEWMIQIDGEIGFFRVAILSGVKHEISPKEAEALVTNQVIQPDALTELVLGLRWPGIVPSGAVIAPLSQGPDSSDATLTVGADSYLFVIDRAPAQKLGHPFTYVLVDANTAVVSTMEAFYPPVVDGVSLLTTMGDRWDPANRFFPEVFDGTQPALGSVHVFEIPEIDLDFVPEPAEGIEAASISIAAEMPGSSTARSTVDCSMTTPKKVAVVVASGADDEIQNDARDMDSLLTNLGFTVTSFNSKTDRLTTVTSGIQAAAQGLGPCDKFFLYISSHTQLVDDNDDGRPDQTPIRMDFGLGHSTKTTWSWFPRHPKGTLATDLKAIKAGKINVMLDTCFSEALAVLIRKYGVSPQPGVELNIFASSAATKTSAGATELDLWLDYDNDDVNSEYTERIKKDVEAARTGGTIDSNSDGTLSIDEIEKVFLDAHFASEDGLMDAQMPQFDRFVGALPTANADDFMLPSGVTSMVSAADNDAKVPGVKYVLTSSPDIHQDLWSWDESTGKLTITGLTEGTSVSFTYKLVVNTYETDPVQVNVSFDGAKNYRTESLVDPDDPQKIRVPCLRLGNLLYPTYQFRLTNSPFDSCKEPHWHSFGNVFAIDVSDNMGRPDPNPPGCGFGRLKEVAQEVLVVDRNTWEQFLIDHIPPL